MNKWYNLDISRVFMTVILPKGVNILFDHCLSSLLICIIFLLKLSSITRKLNSKYRKTLLIPI